MPLARFAATGERDENFCLGLNDGSLISALLPQAGGKILVGGSLYALNESDAPGSIPVPLPSVVRLNTDGSVDNSFSFTNAGLTQINVILNQDGFIYVAAAQFDAGNTRARIIRLFNDGHEDSDFSLTFGTNSMISAMAFDSAGSLLISGTLFTEANLPLLPLVRIQPDGSIDSEFQPGIASNALPSFILPRADGGVDLGGSGLLPGSGPTNGLVRLTEDGLPFGGFQSWIERPPEVLTHAVLPDGRIVLAGLFEFVAGQKSPGVAIFHPNGLLDDSFHSGLDVYPIPVQVKPANDGSLLVLAGLKLIRLNSNGSVDAGFQTGFEIFAPGSSIIPESNGKVLVGGLISPTTDPVLLSGVNGVSLVELNHDGSVNKDIAGLAGLNTYGVYSLTLQADGKMLAFGAFEDSDGHRLASIQRFKTDGQIDPTFNYELGAYTQNFPLALQGDGKILIGRGNGFPSAVVGNVFDGPVLDIAPLLRLNGDGSVDHSFNAPFGINSYVKSVALQIDGKLVVGGYLEDADGNPLPGVVRLNSDGTIDLSFDSSGVMVMSADNISLQADGNVVVVGTLPVPGELFPRTVGRLQSLGQPVLCPSKPGQTGELQMSMRGDVNHSYQLQTSTDLIHWTNLETIFNSTGAIQFTQSGVSDTLRFYRVVLVNP